MSTKPGTTTVRLPRALVDQLRPIAAAHDRSLSGELRHALNAYVRREGPDAQRTLEEAKR